MTRILIVRLGSLGDVVHALPVAAALRRAFPDARIDWLVSAPHRPLLDLVPVIDRRLVVNAPAAAAATRAEAGDEVFSGPGGLIDAIRELRRTRYDVALDLQGLLKSAVLARASGAVRVIGFATRWLREPLARPFYTEVYDPGTARHVIEKNLALLAPLGVRGPTIQFPIDVVDRPVVGEIQRRLDPSAGGRYALINPGAGWPNKRWPPERLGQLAAALRERYALPSVVLFGPGEEDLATGVVRAASGAALAAPPTDIADLVALARHAALFVAGDTGPLHLAAAVGTPIVGLYGPTSAERNGPWSPADVTVSRTAQCVCRERRRCRRSVPCLLDIQVPEVLDAVRRRLAVSTHA